MLDKWLVRQVRNPSNYKFPVMDVIELPSAVDEILDYLAYRLILAHGTPQMIIEECEMLIKDIEDNDVAQLAVIKKYLKENVLPLTGKVIVPIGNFGEVLAATFLIEFENFWFPIYKLRFREKKDWAMRLTDLCLIKLQDESKPLVCYGEVKTNSSDCNKDLAIDGLKSIMKDDALSNQEILRFVCGLLYDMKMLDEARFISRIRQGKIDYDKRYDLFLVHNQEKWSDEVLDKLEAYEIDQRLVNFSVKVILISQLRKVIDTAYECCTTVTAKLIKTMDKQEYLQHAYINLEALENDPKFQGDLAQIRAHSIQEELLPEQPEIRFTYDEKKTWRLCDYIFSESSLILREGYENGIPVRELPDKRKRLLDWAKNAAQSFEFLAKLVDDEDKEILLLNSAICYHVSGYHANAQCIAKMIEKQYLSNGRGNEQDAPDTILLMGFRRALVSFLKRDIPGLQQITRQSLSYISSVQEEIARDVAGEKSSVTEMFNLSAHAFFQQALSDFVQYCGDGEPKHLTAARQNIQESYRWLQQVRDVRLGIILSEVRTLFDLFDEQSTWSNISRYAENLLENQVWRTYLRNLAFEKSIVEFWSSQLKALQSELLTTTDGFVVQMPTSAGKTFIAELSILASLTQKEQKRCLYIAPYRALVNEVENKLAETLGAVGYRVSNLAGGFEFDAFQNFLVTESDVLVATPEKVELLYRTHPEYFENISTVVIDEGHILDEGITSPDELRTNRTSLEELKKNGTLGRGTLLELLITRLKHKLPEARFMLLSAVMPEVNAHDFVTWLSQNRQEPLRIDPTERPSRQTIATFQWKQSSKEKDEPYSYLEYISLPILPDGRRPFVPYFLQKKKYYTGENTPTGRPQRLTWPTDISNKAQSTAMLAVRFARTGPVLVFCAQTSDTEDVMNNIITSLKYLEASNQLPSDSLKYVQNPALESFDLALEWLGENHPLTRGLHYGVGLHYGPLPDPVRQAIEDEFRSSKIQILVSTNTLGQGVNMPIKTAIIYSLERVYSNNGENQIPGRNPTIREPIKKREFWNICGRAGRAGKETEGQIIFVISTSTLNDKKLLKQFKNEANIEEISSALYKLLQALIKKRITEDELIGYLDSHVLALLAEEVVDTQDEDAIREFLGTSLVGVQALRNGIDLTPLVSAIKQTSLWVTNNVPDRNLQKVFSSTGLQVASCKAVEEVVDSYLLTLPREFIESEARNLYLNDDLLLAAFNACRNISEMKLKFNGKYEGPEDEFELIKPWIEGKSIKELRLEYWTPGQENYFSSYIADRIIYKLPWGFNGFLRILAFKLQIKYEDLPISWQYLPSMMRFGVNNIIACLVSNFGVSSRKLALELANLYQPANGFSSSDFLKWIVNLPAEFIMQELEGPASQKQRLLKKINQVVYDDSHLRFILGLKMKLESPVQGIPYKNRVLSALQVHEGDQLVLELEPDNSDDPNAVRVMFNNSQIGYVQRDKARIIAREMQLERKFNAYVKAIKPPTDTYPFPYIEMIIEE